VTINSPSFHTLHTHDYLEPAGTVGMGQIYIGGDAALGHHPLVSPFFDEVKEEKLPPMLVGLPLFLLLYIQLT
jgi:hypothetical protein